MSADKISFDFDALRAPDKKVPAPLKSFGEAFGTLALSPKAAAALNAARVPSVCYDKTKKTLAVALEFYEMIDEGCFTELETKLKARYPFVAGVEIRASYALDETDDMKKLSAYWPNVVAEVGRASRMSRQILLESEWRLTGRVLNISVADGAFYLARKNAGARIEKILSERIGLDVTVRFEENGRPAAAAPPGDRYASELLRLERENGERAREACEACEAGEAAAPEKAKPRAAKNSKKTAPRPKKELKKRSGHVYYNDNIEGHVWKLSEEIEPPCEVIARGKVFRVEFRETKNGHTLVSFDMTDGSGSVTVKFFTGANGRENASALVKNGGGVTVRGMLKYDEYGGEVLIVADEIGAYKTTGGRTDDADIKRVELHLHTTMSAMDATASAEDYIKRAAEWGHGAVAITDHGVAQAYPEAMDAAKKYGVKVVYGLEAYIVDDAPVRELKEEPSDEFVAFDIETTGLSAAVHKITEIGAVKIKNGEVVGSFGALVDPKTKIPPDITALTGITDEMVRGQPTIGGVLPDFLKFVGEAGLVAHNAKFDMKFIRRDAKKLGMTISNAVHDTLQLSQMLFPELKRHKLDSVAEHLKVEMGKHHRARDDAKTCAEIFLRCRELTRRDAAFSHRQLRHTHAVLLVKNAEGLRNLYELVSKSHIEYFARRPRIPKSELNKLRGGLIVGSACSSGELFRAVMEKETEERVREIASFYDYFEIHPTGNSMHLVKNGSIGSVAELIEINKTIWSYGKKWGVPVVAAGDAHFLDPEDDIYRKIIMHAENYTDAEDQPPLYFRTTGEMLEEFAYLGDGAYEAVVTNTRMIADMAEDIKPIPDGAFVPKIEGSEARIKEITRRRARAVYGDEPPAQVSERLERELASIVSGGFTVLYDAAERLVSRSVAEGYLVGSRGSIGASLAATMAGITEVNPLSPHYLCPACKYADFDSAAVAAYSGKSGCDMPDADCPVCGTPLVKDGHDIPFETFTGFGGEKEPDIDLNFASEYQARSHAHTEEIFGKSQVFRAGTIGTMAEKTAFGYVKKYLDDRKLSARNAELNRLKLGLVGVKRTSGQHPGGMVLVPEGMSVYEFSPVQYPANDASAGVVTTHFDYNALKGRLLKLDNLGHDVPTMIRMLHETTGVDPLTTDLGDAETLSLFTSPKALGVTPRDIDCKTGSLGLPEFGTAFVRQMLVETQPDSFTGLVRICGLSHGTDVWLNNAAELIKNKTATLTEVISSREDIMLYLEKMGVDKKAAFGITENVRTKDKNITEDEEDLMLRAGVPEWYVESCKRITYLFPKSHAVAYVMMTVRIGYFKIHHPYAFYAASFSVKAEDFDYELMCFGRERAYKEISRINSLGKESTAKEKNTLGILELVIEMYARGLRFMPLDLYAADAYKFLVTRDEDGPGLMAPLCSVQGLGGGAAESVAEARAAGDFMSVNDFRERTKVNKTVVELLKKTGILNNLPETNQMSLF